MIELVSHLFNFLNRSLFKSLEDLTLFCSSFLYSQGQREGEGDGDGEERRGGCGVNKKQGNEVSHIISCVVSAERRDY